MPTMASTGRQSDSLNIQLLVDSIPALIHTARPDGYLDYFNKPWLDYLGVTLDKVAGWNWTAFIHPEDLNGIVSKWRACLASGEDFECETRVRKPNGDYRWMLHRKVPLRDGSGVILKWYGSSLDVHERKTADEQLWHKAEELQRSEFYLAEGQRLAQMGSWALDSKGFSYWSRELFLMHGLDPSSKPPSVEEYLDRVHPHDREFMATLIDGLSAKASAFDATKRVVRPNGEVRYIRCAGAPVVGTQSQKKYIGSAIDVTAHELLTQTLRRREAYLTEAQRLSHTGSFGWNVSTDEHFWSDETFRIFDFTPSSKISLQMILERVHPGDRSSAETAISTAIRGEGIDLELRLLLPDGGIKYLHVVGKTEKDQAGSVEIIGAVMDVTARKQTEIELRRSKAHLADAQTLSRTGSVGMEVNTKRIFWSAEAARIYGYPPGTEPTPDLILQRSHPDDVGVLKDAIQRATQGGSDFDFEHRLLMPDGSIKHVRDLTHWFKDEAGSEEIVGAIMDITERKLAEEAIRRSEAYLADAQRLSHTGSFGWKPDTGEIVWSDETYRIFEYDRTGKPTLDSVLQRIHPDDRPACRKVIDEAVNGARNFDHIFRLLMADGRVKHVHALHGLRDASGNREFVGAVTDITERQTAEDKIRDQEMELRQIVNFVPQLIAVYGANRERFYANRTALDYLGVSLYEWQQKNFGASAHPEDSERLKVCADRALSSGAAEELELRLRKHDGSYRWFLARLNPLRDEQGQIRRWYFTGTDIEDRKRAEDTLLRENVALREEIDKASMFEEIVGTSKALKAVLSRISKVAASNSTVLLTGETGTGKELVARAIHRRSNRASHPFVSVNCAATPRDLIASELFGHEKGAFTGATHQRLGRFELASGGTLFLDEVGELPAETQIALLRVLQEREFERVGGTRRIHADVRVIAATNRDLQSAIGAGSFRGDLFYRLNVFPIEIPPLRERKGDIRLLVEYFIDRYARKLAKTITTLDIKTLDLLESYPWPGNIRELQNVIERSVILCETESFSVDESWLSQPAQRKTNEQVYLSEKVAAREKEIIETALRECQGRVFGPSGAAAKLGIARSTLESKIRSLKINKNRFKT